VRPGKATIISTACELIAMHTCRDQTAFPGAPAQPSSGRNILRAVTQSALVLAYHGLGSYPRELDPFNLMVEPERFRWQVSNLRRRGYRFVSLKALAAQLERPGGVPRGLAALTFDDGTTDNLTVLAPLLAELELPATVFACPGLLGKRHFAMPAEAGVKLMDAEELRMLASSPFVEIGSHTSRHTELADASTDEAYAEMTKSKQELEELLQTDVDTFAYPKCGYSADCPDAARRAGYAVAVTCGGLGGWRRWELARESIDSLDGRLTFALKSRKLFLPMRESLLGRAARRAARPIRHARAPSRTS
jgi:peptidoglycan/xylan/chitin deacetylase (PgdA/CDA1 family)